MYHKDCENRVLLVLNTNFRFLAIPHVSFGSISVGDMYVEKESTDAPDFYCPQCNVTIKPKDYESSLLFRCQETKKLHPPSHMGIDARGRFISKAVAKQLKLEVTEAKISL